MSGVSCLPAWFIPFQFRALFENEFPLSLSPSLLPKQVNCTQFPLEVEVTGSLGHWDAHVF